MPSDLRRPERPARSITAAARQLPVRDDRAPAAASRRTDSGWQAEAWTFFDEVPEVKFAARFLGNALSRLRLYPAVVVNPDDPPMPLAAAAELPESGITAEVARIADEAFAALDQGAEGLPGLLREWGVCLSMVGDSYLVGRDVDGVEEWRVYSESAVVRTDGVLGVKETPNGRPEPLADDDFVARVWRRHSRWPGLSDSNMRSVLDVCEELLIYGRQFRAVGRSRNNAGILLLPNELDFEPQTVRVDGPDPDDPDVGAQEDTDDLTDLERGIIESLITPTSDDGSASQVVPHLLRGTSAALKEVRHIPLDRKIDEQAIPRMVHLISRLANGLDVPVEVLTGVADANHWTAWQIEDSTYKAHVEPLASIPAQALAAVFLRPAMLDAAVDPAVVRRIVVAIDPSALVVRPNRVADAKDAFDRDALSYEALRQYLGFSASDAPTMEELLLKYTLDRSIGGMSLTRDLLNEIGISDVPDGAESAAQETEAKVEAAGETPAAPSSTPENGGEPTPEQPATARALALLAAAGSAQSQLGERLASIDARLRDRVQLAASEALTTALARAGARLRNRVQGDPDLASAVKGQPNERVGATVGAVVDPADLLDESDFAQLHVTFLAWVEQARREAIDVARRDAASHGVDQGQFAELASVELAGSDDDDGAGWLLLLAALLTLGRSRIFTPDGTPDDGEFDPHVAVPPGPVREALARAGGALGETGPPSATGAGAATGGPASGTRMLRLVQRTGSVQVAWRWDVGMPTVPFPPHQALSGVVFDSWNAAELTNAGSFPARAFYYPGDHKGCQCDAVPVLVYTETATLAPPSAAVPGFGTPVLV